MASSPQEGEVSEAASNTGTDPIVLAAVASVAYSWYHYYLRGNKEMGLFVGLWPPTLLAFASYFQQERIAARLERVMSGGRIRESVERMVRGSS